MGDLQFKVDGDFQISQSCEHNSKRIRTCKTGISPYRTIFTTTVPSLIELCAHVISLYCHTKQLDLSNISNETYPNSVVQLLLHYMHDDKFVNILGSPKSLLRNTNISELCISKRVLYRSFTAHGSALSHLKHHALNHLQFSSSDITSEDLSVIAENHASRVQYLDIGYCLRVEVFDSVFKLLNLTYLNLERTQFKLTPTTGQLFFGLKSLRYLGLSYLKKHSAAHPLQIGFLTAVSPDLLGLDLSETAWDTRQHESFKHFRQLKYLDISSHPVWTVRYDDVIKYTLVQMTSLKSLDISNAILDDENIIHRLQSLKLDFLGILGDRLQFIFLQNFDSLAVKIASNFKLHHVLVTLNKYTNKVCVLETALKSMYTLLRDRLQLGYNYHNLESNLREAVLDTMERYPNRVEIHHLGSACLITLNHTVHFQQTPTTVEFRRQARRGISLLLISLNLHHNSFDVLKFCVLLLPDFYSYEKDFMFYEIICSLISVLNNQVTTLQQSSPLSMTDSDRESSRLISFYTVRAINTLVCTSSCDKKTLVGQMKLIETILDILKLGFNMFKQSPHETEGMEFCVLLVEAWSTLWNATDEQPDNCKRFVDNGGLEFYLETYQVCSRVRTDDANVMKNIVTLIRNMLGLLGNIAEVEYIRPKMLQPDLIMSFNTLKTFTSVFFESVSDLMEIKYSAAGILSHICSDGASKWTIADPSYESVLQGIEQAVESWELQSERSINYKSFHPILRILKIDCPYPCKLWAVWALSNLCTFKPRRFVPMLRRDEGVELLTELCNEADCPSNIRYLCDVTLKLSHDSSYGPEIDED